MAVGEDSIPKDLLPVTLNRAFDPHSPGSSLFFSPPCDPFANPPPPWATASATNPPFSSSAAAVTPPASSPPCSSSAAAGYPDGNSSHPKKIKFLCSFGGRILLRPNDGSLRYVGGQTRIISVRKDMSFAELMSKMAEASGGPAVVKYQLPGEDLDALVSVSCPEDVVNMIEEYDKLAATLPDGSAKLRAFLFSPSESADLSATPAADFTGEEYVEAINGVTAAGGAGMASVSGMRRRGSITSVASSAQNFSIQNSEAGDSTSGGTSPSPLSPTVGASDTSRVGYVGESHRAVIPDALRLPGVNVSAPGLGVPPQNPNLVRPDQSPVAPYVPQEAFREPHQAQYINPQHLGMGGGPQPINIAAFPMHPCVPGIPIGTSPPASQAGILKPIQAMEEPSLENPYGGVQLPCDQNSKAFQPLLQLPPLLPSYLLAQNAEMYDRWQAVPPSLQFPALRSEDCYMCHKSLPHAHSDPLIQDRGNGSQGSNPESSPMFYSQPLEDAMRHQALHSAAGAAGDNVVEARAESMAAIGQLGGYGLPQIPEAQKASERPTIQMADDLDPMRILCNTGVIGLSGGTQTSSGMLFGTPSQSHMEDRFQWQWQQQQSWQTVQPTQRPVKQDILTCHGIDSSTVKNENVQAAEPLMQDYVTGYSHDYVRPIDEKIEALHLSPTKNSETRDRGKAFVCSSDIKLDGPHLAVESGCQVRPQPGANALFLGDDFVDSGFVSKENCVKPMEQTPFSTLDATYLQNHQPVFTSQAPKIIGNHGPFPHNLGVELDYPISNGQFLGKPAYTSGIIPDYSDKNMIPVADWKDEVFELHSKDMPNHFTPPPSGSIPFPSLSATSHTGHVEALQESFSPNSLFSNQDPWKVLAGAHLLPPRPCRVASRESLVPKDPCIENHLGNSNGSNVVALLDKCNPHHPLDLLNEELCQESVQLTKGSGEKHIKQQLQAVAEGVAALVLQSSLPPVSLFSSHEMKELTSEFDEGETAKDEAVVDQKIEDINSKQVDKINPGLQITEDIEHLQIIKNSDLEELSELGSGTFGTVYHGKWRGSDVAIKRINDRCFAGRPSEEERMRADFWNEARKLADLHHPNVLAFYGVVLDSPGESVATVTEYMVTGSLRQALQRNDKTLDQCKRLLIAMDVAFGMEYLHGKNIVHFDLKSDNLLVNLRDPQRPICKVGDLGLSKMKCHTLISGGVRGTLPWMAPELLSGSSSLVSEKVDVFSFGIVMWELLTGEEPYADLHYGAIIGGIVSNTLRPPVPETCDPEWRKLMEQCWSAEPSERPSFTEIANELRSMEASFSHNGQK